MLADHDTAIIARFCLQTAATPIEIWQIFGFSPHLHLDEECSA
jgi:hypothetical protein